MAEAIARSLAPAGVEVASAGSSPGGVHPHALSVLEECGLDASAHRSKGIAEVDLGRVRAVVTLCAEEACPVVPGDVERHHWPLPDPAAVTGDDECVRAAFREVRDALRERLSAFLAQLG